MRRFYCSSGSVSGSFIRISNPAQLHHIRDVLRFKPEDSIMFFDESGNEYSGKIVNFSGNEILINVVERREAAAHSRPVLTVACAIPKKTKMEDIVDKLTQVGVDRILPMVTERVIVKLDRRKIDSKGSRWNKISIQASEQSKRKYLPEISPVCTFEEALSLTRNSGLKLIPTLEGKRADIRDILAAGSSGDIAILIGPEGDFSPQEIEKAFAQGFIPVTLGKQVLRVDTAAVVAAGFIKLYIGI